MSDQRNNPAFEAIVGDDRIVGLTIQDARDIAAKCASAIREFLAERTKTSVEETRDWTDEMKPDRPTALNDVTHRLWKASRAVGDDFLLMDVIQVLIYARDLQ